MLSTFCGCPVLCDRCQQICSLDWEAVPSQVIYSSLCTPEGRCRLQAVALSYLLVFILFTHIEICKPGWTKHYRGICSESSFLKPSTIESLHCMCIEIRSILSNSQNSFVLMVNSINNFWQLFFTRAYKQRRNKRKRHSKALFMTKGQCLIWDARMHLFVVHTLDGGFKLLEVKSFLKLMHQNLN